VLDAHVHVWDTGELAYPLFDGHPVLGRSHRLDDYFAEATAVGVQRVICVEAASADGRGEAEWLARHADQRVAGIVAWAPLERPDLADHLRLLRRLRGRIVGVRRSFEFEPSGFPRRPDVIRGARLAGEHGLVVDLVLFHRSLAAAIDLVRACPGTSFVLDHLGKPPIAVGAHEPWATRLADFASLPNVSAKLSGLITEAGEGWSHESLAPYLEHAVACFGYERLMIGSDWPIVGTGGGLERWFVAVRDLLATAATGALAGVLAGNAARVYGV
jgi:L-fuconolactonase